MFVLIAGLSFCQTSVIFSADAAAEVDSKIKSLINDGKLAEAEDAILFKARQTAHATDEYVHENPWRSVGVAAAVGVIIGMLIGRR